jgi:hypothetical protein
MWRNRCLCVRVHCEPWGAIDACVDVGLCVLTCVARLATMRYVPEASDMDALLPAVEAALTQRECNPSAIQCSAVQCSAVQCSAVQCGTGQTRTHQVWS